MGEVWPHEVDQPVEELGDPPLLLRDAALQHVEPRGVDEGALRAERVLHQNLQHLVDPVGVAGLAGRGERGAPVGDSLNAHLKGQFLFGGAMPLLSSLCLFLRPPY